MKRRTTSLQDMAEPVALVIALSSVAALLWHWKEAIHHVIEVMQ